TLEFRRGDLNGLMRRTDRVADAREEVRDRVRHRHRVSTSAFAGLIMSGNVLPVISRATLLPGRLRHPGHLAVVGELAQADAAHPVLSIHRARSPAAVAAI